MKPNQKKSSANSNSRWSKPHIYIVIIALINILIFSQTSNYDFVNIDDGLLIHENPLVTDSNVPYSEVFQSKLFGPHYKPLTFLTWKFQYHNIGKEATHFHTINWILHVLNSVLLFLIGIQLFRRLYDDHKHVLISSFLLALLFSINPLRLESVAWAIERKDVLFTFFFLLSWYAYIFYIKQNKYVFLILGALLYLLSGLSKSMGLTLIAVVFLTDLWYNRKFYLKTLITKIPYLLVFGLLIYLYGILGSGAKGLNEVIATTEATGQITTLALIDNLPTSLQWLLSASMRFVLWIVHSFIPLKLSIDYSADAIFGFFSYAVFLFPLLVIGLFYYGWKIRKTSNVILAGLLFFGITISPVLAYTQAGQAAFLADRYTYIPSIGLFFILVYWLNTFQTNKAKQFMLTGGILLFYLLTTLSNIGNWRNSETLFKQVLNVNPNSSLAHLNLGQYYRTTNQANRAIEIYSKGIQVAPDAHKLYSNRGKIYFDQNNIDLALIDFNKSLDLNSEDADVLANRGASYGIKQDWIKCFADLDKALEINPNNLNALSNRGIAHYSQGNYEGTITDYRRYLEIDPNEPDIQSTLGTTYSQLGQYNEAIACYNNAIRINSNRGIYYLNRSFAHNSNGDKANALKDAEKAQRLGQSVNATYLNSLRQ